MRDLSYVYDCFQKNGTGKSFPKGSTLHVQGGGVSDVHYIIEGVIKITDSDRYGNGRTVTLFGKNHVIPLSWLFIQEPKRGALYNYVALANTKTLCLSRSEIHDALEASPIAYKFLADAVSKGYINAASRIHNLQKTNVTEKVEFVLYYLATLLGDINNDRVAMIEAILTHQDIAEVAGLSRESVTHLLSKPKYRELIWKSDGKTCIDLKKLDSSAMPPVFSLRP